MFLRVCPLRGAQLKWWTPSSPGEIKAHIKNKSYYGSPGHKRNWKHEQTPSLQHRLFTVCLQIPVKPGRRQFETCLYKDTRSAQSFHGNLPRMELNNVTMETRISNPRPGNKPSMPSKDFGPKINTKVSRDHKGEWTLLLLLHRLPCCINRKVGHL